MKIWKQVLGYEGFYIISNFGDVKRVKPSQGTNCKILKKSFDEGGYPIVWLSKNNKSKKKRVHSLVCEAFHGPRP